MPRTSFKTSSKMLNLAHFRFVGTHSSKKFKKWWFFMIFKICSNHQKSSSKVLVIVFRVSRSYFRPHITFLDTIGQIIGHSGTSQKSSKSPLWAKIEFSTKCFKSLKWCYMAGNMFLGCFRAVLHSKSIKTHLERILRHFEILDFSIFLFVGSSKIGPIEISTGLEISQKP